MSNSFKNNCMVKKFYTKKMKLAELLNVEHNDFKNSTDSLTAINVTHIFSLNS